MYSKPNKISRPAYNLKKVLFNVLLYINKKIVDLIIVLAILILILGLLMSINGLMLHDSSIGNLLNSNIFPTGEVADNFFSNIIAASGSNFLINLSHSINHFGSIFIYFLLIILVILSTSFTGGIIDELHYFVNKSEYLTYNLFNLVIWGIAMFIIWINTTGKLSFYSLVTSFLLCLLNFPLISLYNYLNFKRVNNS